VKGTLPKNAENVVVNQNVVVKFGGEKKNLKKLGIVIAL